MKRIQEREQLINLINPGQLSLITGFRNELSPTMERWPAQRWSSFNEPPTPYGRDDDNDLSSLSTTPLHTIGN